MNTPSNLVKYNGVDFPQIGISNGMPLNDVFTKIYYFIGAVLDQSVDFGGANKKLTYKEAIQELNKTLANLNVEDIKYSGVPGTTKALSYDAISLLNEKVKGDYNISGPNLVFTYDYSFLNKVKGSYIYKTKLYGTNNGVMVSLQDKNSSSGAVTVPVEKLPITIDIELIVQRPEGDISLSNTQRVYGAQKRTEQLVFDIKEYGSVENNTSLLGVIETLFKRSEEQTSFKDQMSKFEIDEFKNLPGQKGILPALSTLYAFADSLKEETVSLNKINIVGGQKDMSIQDAFTSMEQKNIATALALKNKDIEINTLKSQMQQLSGFYSTIVNNLSGGSLNIQNQSSGSGGTSGAGGCFGAGCGGGPIIVTEPGQEELSNSITPTTLTDDTFISFIASGVSFVDFYMDGCNPCAQMESTVGLLNGYFNRDAQTVSFGKINLSSQIQVKQNYSISFVPIFIIFKSGAEVERIEGVRTFEYLKERIEAVLA